MIATRAISGTIFSINSSRFPLRSGDMRLSPVTLPPGRARLLTSPVPSGSPADVMTMGIVAVACLAASGASVPAATITSTLRRTNSAANSVRRSLRFSAYRYSMTMVLPSIQPNWRKPSSKAGSPGLPVPAVRKPRLANLAVCCARTASGHTVAKPIIALEKSRRRITSPKGSELRRLGMRLQQYFAARKMGFNGHSAEQQPCTAHVALESFATAPNRRQAPAMSASLRKRQNCCLATKCRDGPIADVCASIGSFRGEHIVSRQRTTDPLERELAHRLDRHSVLDRHQHAWTDEDLPRFGFIAEPRGHVGYRADSGIVEASLKADGAERGKSVGDADADADLVAQPPTLLRQRSDDVTHFERHQHRLERRLLDRHWVIEHHHHPVAGVTLERAAVLDDDFADGGMIVAQQRHHVFRVRAFGEAGEAAQVAEQRGNLPAVAFELLLRTRRDDQISHLRRQKSPQPAHALDFAHLVGDALFELLV